MNPWTAAHQASLSYSISWSLLKFMSIESVMLSNHLILCCPFSFYLQSFLASGPFPVSQLFTSGGQRSRASASVLPMNIQGSVQLLSNVRLFVTPWIAARQASLSTTNSLSSLKLTSIKSVMPSNHLILCHPLLILPSIFPSMRVLSDELALRIRWPKYCSFSFSMDKHKGKCIFFFLINCPGQLFL